MIVAIADTHTAIWYLFSDPRLGSGASAFIEAAIARGDHIGVSALSLAEMIYLIEKGRIPAGALDDLQAAIGDPKAVLQHVAFDENIAMEMRKILDGTFRIFRTGSLRRPLSSAGCPY